jgi:hypothetical protein
VYHAHDTGLYEKIYIINSPSINANSFNYFNYSLSFELWEDIFAEKVVNIIFNSFLITFLRNFHSNFPLIRKTKNKKSITKDTGWVTPSIKHFVP